MPDIIDHLIDHLRTLSIHGKEYDSYTGFDIIEGLETSDLPKTARYIRSFISRNPSLTFSIKAGPLMQRISSINLPLEVSRELYEKIIYPKAEGTQPQSPPEPPRPASDDRRDFDRPNAPQRPSPDDSRGSPEGLTPDLYQQLALRTESRKSVLAVESGVNQPSLAHDQQSRLLHAAIGICTEAGELQDTLKRMLWYGKPLDLVNVMEEAGDLLWYIALLLDAAGYRLSHAMGRNLDKLSTRYPEKFTSEAALIRDLENERRTLEDYAPSHDCHDDCHDDCCKGHQPGLMDKFAPGTLGSEMRYDPETGTNYQVFKQKEPS